MNELVKVLPNFRKFNDYINNVKNNTTLIIKITGKVDNIESDTKELIQINNTASIVNYNIQSNNKRLLQKF